jgi:kinesin family protein C1
MEAERAALSELKADHEVLSRELATVRNQEINQRRELVHASDEIEALKRRHAREMEDLEISSRKKDRELRDTKEDLRITQEDLERERETVTSLKATIAQQSTAQISLTTQVNALQVQMTALQQSLNVSSENASCLKFDLEAAQTRIKELEMEVREAEMVRRRLHNMVQELKGNIRVFCRVRPLLPSDVAPEIASSSSTSSLVLVSKPGSPVPEDLEKLREDYLASIAYPDKFDHKEIILSSSSENAMGQERKEKWCFSFDRVRCGYLRVYQYTY